MYAQSVTVNPRTDIRKVALANGVNYTDCLNFVREARKQGLKAPVLLMGYYNPILSYTEELAVAHAKEAGANGFIVVDLPPEEAVAFRKICTGSGWVWNTFDHDHC